VTDPGLTFDGLSLRLGRHEVLSDVSLDCPSGSVTCLIGPNGAGKSTLLALAAGLRKPSAGRVGIGSGSGPARDGMPGVAYLPQESHFPGLLTVREVFAFACAARANGAAARHEAAEVSGIESMLDRPVRELSGGWVRRLGLAVALLRPASLLLLDEPFVGLDPQTLDRVLGHLDGRRTAGDTILIASHEFELIDLLPRRVAVLDGGRLRAVLPATMPDSRHLYRTLLAPETAPLASERGHAT
jgi:ABC-type multidrug transport system ATPase subunit